MGFKESFLTSPYVAPIRFHYDFDFKRPFKSTSSRAQPITGNVKAFFL